MAVCLCLGTSNTYGKAGSIFNTSSSAHKAQHQQLLSSLQHVHNEIKQISFLHVHFPDANALLQGEDIKKSSSPAVFVSVLKVTWIFQSGERKRCAFYFIIDHDNASWCFIKTRVEACPK